MAKIPVWTIYKTGSILVDRKNEKAGGKVS
jgi:hypothetical protein